MNQYLHHLGAGETVFDDLHLHQPILNRQLLPQNPNETHHLIHPTVLSLLVETVHHRRRRIAATLLRQQLLDPPIEFSAVSQPIQRHQSSEVFLVEEDLRDLRAPCSLDQLALSVRVDVDVDLREIEASFPEKRSDGGGVSAVRSREEGDTASDLLFAFQLHEDLDSGDFELRHVGFVEILLRNGAVLV